MKEATGSAFILNMVIIFITLMMLIFVGSISYSKSYKVKNRIINILEEEKNFDLSVQGKIEDVLSSIGYQISNTADCSKYKPTGSTQVYPTNGFANYRYCIFENRSNDHVYYTVVTFMKFDFPIIGDFVEFPVKGQTKIFNELWD